MCLFVCVCPHTHTHTILYDLSLLLMWHLPPLAVEFLTGIRTLTKYGVTDGEVSISTWVTWILKVMQHSYCQFFFFFYCRYAWLPMFVQNLLMKFLHWSQPWRYDMSGFVIFLENYMLDRLLCQVFAYYSISSSMFDK